jgi:homoserine/homoserine lactone efflux protein
MNEFLFISYLVTISAIIITPGPNALLMISHSMNHGKIAAIKNALGSACAAAILITIALVGVKNTIPKNLMPILTIVGSLYLIFIGFNGVKNYIVDETVEVKRKWETNFFLQSFLTGISNPKDIIFFILFLPQFIDNSINFQKSALLLIVGWILCDVIIMSGYGVLAMKAGKTLSPIFISKATRCISAIVLFIGSSLFISSIYRL